MAFSLEDPQSLNAYGACVVRGVLTSAEVDFFKARLAEVSGIEEKAYQQR